MVDRADLSRVNELYGEMDRIEQALQGFDHGGGIVQMIVSRGPVEAETLPGIFMDGVVVSTVGIPVPPGMIDAVKSALHARLGQLDTELAGFGLTGIGER